MSFRVTVEPITIVGIADATDNDIAERLIMFTADALALGDDVSFQAVVDASVTGDLPSPARATFVSNEQGPFDGTLVYRLVHIEPVDG